MEPVTDQVRARANERFAQLYEQLNAEQKQAVDTTEGTVMVLAGPGTGKTQLLAMRIANILQRTQMDPWNILCVTFTESGVAAMRERLLSIMGEAAYYVRLHTFHSFCNEIIQEHPELFSRAQEWQPLTDVERVELLEELLDALPGTSPLKIFGQPYFYLKDINAHLQALKQEHITPAALRKQLTRLQQFTATIAPAAGRFLALTPVQRTDAACAEMHAQALTAAAQAGLPDTWLPMLVNTGEGTREASKARTMYKNNLKRSLATITRHLPAQRALADIFEQYQARLVQRGRYDYEDMINQVITAFSANADLLAEYQEQFQYILVDEYQDTNGAQNEIVHWLGSFDDRPNLCVVGDDKQSIYRFQGASLANMLDFYQRYQAHVRVISLQQNYRSQPTLLTAADALIAHNRESLTKYIPGATFALHAQTQRLPQPLAVREATNVDVEDYRVAQEIRALLDEGAQPCDIAVIVRYHRDSGGVLAALRHLDIPVRLEAGEDALHATVVQNFLRLLECIDDAQRDDLLADVIHFTWLGLPELDVLKVIRRAVSQRLALWSVLNEAAQLTAAGVAAPPVWQSLARTLARWRARAHNTSLLTFLQEVLAESGLLAYMLLPTTGPEVLSAMRRILDEAKALNAAHHDLSLPGFLQATHRLQRHGLPLMTRPWQMSDNAVRVMTAHKAKGLEFEHVFLPRMVDKHWGNAPSPTRLPLPPGLIRHDAVLGGQNNEDERRLLYVALTRARATVTISYARTNEAGRPSVPALFIHELPPASLAVGHWDEDFAAGQERLISSLQPVASRPSADIAVWVDSLVKSYVMSVTHLNNYLTCPRLFYIRTILRVPAIRSVHQALGTAVHRALDAFLACYQKDGRCPPPDFLLRSFEQSLRREIVTPDEARDIRDVGRGFLAAYWDRWAADFNPDAVSELNFASHGVRVGPAAVTGTIDKIEWLDKKRERANVVDYKTGQPDGKSAALKPGGEYYRQLVFYKILCERSPQFTAEMVSGEIDFVQPSRSGKFVKKKIAVTDSDVKELEETIERVWHEIQDRQFLDSATWCGKCEYCVSVGVG